MQADHGKNRHGRQIVIGLIGLALGAIVLMWAWNTIASGLLAAPQADFRHGLAAALTIAVCANIMRCVWRFGGKA